MELSKINKLLEKYLEGETSLEEEKILKAYFSSGEVAPELKEYQVLFGYFKTERQQTPMERAPEPKKKKHYSWLGVAASIAIVASLFLFKPEQRSTDLGPPSQNQSLAMVDVGKIEDPQIALQKTKEVLNLIAQQMNTGKEKLVYLHEIDKTKNELINP